MLQRDPVFSVRILIVLVVAAFVEIAVATLCIVSTKSKLAISALGSISIAFLFYRVMLVWLGFKGYCPCLGSFTDDLGLSRPAVDLVLVGILVYLLAGSCIAWFCFVDDDSKSQSLR